MIRLKRLSLCVSMLAVIGSVALAASPAAAAHLYATGNGALLVRFPIINGVPTRFPDLVVQNVGGPLAFSPFGGADSVLYAADGDNIFAFNYGHTKPDRIIALPPTSPGLSWSVAGLAVDRAGFLYVGAFQTGSYAFGHRNRVRVPAAGVLVYSPTANGNARPVATLSNAYVLAIAIDKLDDLFVCGQNPDQSGFCDRFADVRTRAKMLSSFTGPTLGDMTGAVVIGSDLYVSSQDQTQRYDFTAQVFPVTANGSGVLPTREIVPTSGSVEGELAAFAGMLYAQGGFGAYGIWEFDADESGGQPALAEVAKFRYNVSGVAIGR